MLFRQIIHEDLGCASYLVGDPGSGRALVVDPQWDIDPYLHLSRLHGVRIEHVLETHNHADHVSGHGRLARATGATIHVNRLAEAEYEHEGFDDGWTLELGEAAIVEAVHTPGHRPEHTCFLLRDPGHGGDPVAVLSGDSLFVGDVARPDLAIEPREGAAKIFRSLHERLLVLPDDVEVWPGHLGGSLCGSSGIDLKTSSTIGFERRHNRALAIGDEAAFVEDAVGSIGERPPNVEHIVALNRGPLVESVGAPTRLSPVAFEAAIAKGAVAVDSRTNEQFDEAHIPGAISASAYDTGFATKVAQVVPPEKEVVIVAASDGNELHAAELLAAVGLRVRGFLGGGMSAWRAEERPVERIEAIGPDDLAERLDGTRAREDGKAPLVLDVRRDEEFADGHIPDSLHIPFGDLPKRLDELPRDRPIATICKAGARSGLAASVLQREGFEGVMHVARGGVGTWQKEGRAVEASPSRTST
ncbi:MAG TPA: rhodanese-like domain-containing protein [Solirubrobacterales bacterium]|nr:rhodanese-like domain-containing protein [Solirubrobacterales bacterium]